MSKNKNIEVEVEEKKPTTTEETAAATEKSDKPAFGDRLRDLFGKFSKQEATKDPMGKLSVQERLLALKKRREHAEPTPAVERKSRFGGLGRKNKSEGANDVPDLEIVKKKGNTFLGVTLPFGKKQEPSEEQAESSPKPKAQDLMGFIERFKQVGNPIGPKAVGRLSFVSTISDAKKVQKGASVMLYGVSTPGATQLVGMPEQFVTQPSRRAMASQAFSFGGNKKNDEAPEKFYIWVREEIIKTLTERGCKIYFAADQFLRWGQKESKGKHLLLVTGGYAGSPSNETPVDIWHFDDGGLLSFSQRNISPRNSENFQDEMQTIVKTERMGSDSSAGADAVFVYKDLDGDKVLEDQVGYLPFDVFAAPVSYKVRTRLKRNISLGSFLIPTLIVSFSAAAVGGIYFKDHNEYVDWNKKFKIELNAFQGDPRQSNALIDRYESYQAFFTENKQESAAAIIENITSAIASMKGYAYLNSIEVDLSGEEDYDFLLRVAIPADSGVSSLEIGKPVIEELSSLIGAQLAGEADGIKVQSTEDKRRFEVRNYTIYGFFNQDDVALEE